MILPVMRLWSAAEADAFKARFDALEKDLAQSTDLFNRLAILLENECLRANALEARLAQAEQKLAEFAKAY